MESLFLYEGQPELFALRRAKRDTNGMLKYT